MIEMKTLFFHPRNDYTGSTRVLADILASEYHDNTVVVVTRRNSNQGFLSELPNVRIIGTWTPTYHKKNINVISFVCWILSAFIISFCIGFKYDRFYINTTKPFYAAIVGRLLGKEVIYHVHEIFALNSMTTKIYRYVFDRVPSHRIFVSEYTKNQYKENPKCTWEIKYNKLNDSFISKVRVTPIEQRQRKNILMIASPIKIKGIFMFADVAKAMPNYQFSLILSANKERIAECFGNDVPSNLMLYPAQSDIHPFLKKTDLIMNLSVPGLCTESFGMTILEAMPYGIPAIVPNVGGPTELVKDGYNGYCVDVTDKDSIIDAIEKVMSVDKYCSFATNALNQYTQIFA